jgi:type I restriction enzyme S subunit
MTTIGEIFKVSSGGTPSRKNHEYFDGGNIPWIKTGDLKGKYVGTPAEFITQDGLDNSSAKLFPANTVLLAMYGATIGSCSILPFKASTNQACAALLPSDNCNETYLYYYLRSIKKSLIQMGVGGAQPNISAGLIKGVKIPLPPLAEQKQIAAILDAADSLRQKEQQLVEHYTALSQSLFFEMFGDPVANLMGWNIRPLSDLFFVKGGKRLPKGSEYEQGITEHAYIRVKDFQPNSLDTSDIKYISPEIHDAIKKYTITSDDIYISIAGTIGIVGIVPNHLSGANLTENAAKIVAKDQVSYKKEFVSYYLNSSFCQNHIKSKTMAVGVPKLALFRIEELPYIDAPLQLQNQFAERITIIEQQKQQAQANLQKSEALFNSLLQRAFTGELTADRAA